MQESKPHSLAETTENPSPDRSIDVGDFRAQVSAARLHHITYRGVEILRAIELVIRDDAWGTLELQTLNEKEARDADGWQYCYRAEARSKRCGTLVCDMRIRITQDSIAVNVQLNGSPMFTTARAGLVALYPLDNTVGKPAVVWHNDGRTEDLSFPEYISPSQPFFDIAAIKHKPAAGLIANCRFFGDVFEMEDQRNWTDASFKVYNRPLAWPSPYVIDQVTGARQQVRVDVDATVDAPKAYHRQTSNSVKVRVNGCSNHCLPELGTGLDILQARASNESTDLLRDLTPKHVQLLIDLRTEQYRRDLQKTLDAVRAAEIPTSLWAGVITPDTLDQHQALANLARALADMQAPLTGVLALPAAYLKSYQPDAQWPTGASPDDAADAARAVFPDTPVGGGMLTYFTEVNRRRPDPGRIDFISHATTAIVHAADDVSVMETLDGIRHVFRSCRALAPDKPYRLGMSAIGMWANPYGDQPLPNPERRRLPMAGRDPRQLGLFAAAWNLGYYAVASRVVVDSMTLSSVCGPFAIGAADRRYPVFHVLRGLVRGSGQQMLDVTTDPGAKVAVVGWCSGSDSGCELWLANLVPETIQVEFEGMHVDAVRLLDADNLGTADTEWIDELQIAATATQTLGPYAVLRLTGRARW